VQLVQAPTLLSKSILWDLQRRSYSRQGSSAWRQNGVPMHIVSNPFDARACAQTLFGFLRDRWLISGDEHRVVMVELGCGSGRFGFALLKELVSLQQSSSLQTAPFTLVLTDFTASNVDQLVSHPQLQPFVQRGVLDFAEFNALTPGPLSLRVAETVLDTQALQHPLVLIANYLFDSIEQDAFSVRAGSLHTLLVGIRSELSAEDLLQSPEAMQQITLVEERVRLTGSCGDPYIDGILKEYATFMEDTDFLFPTAAVSCLDWFLAQTEQRLVVLSQDKGCLDIGHIIGMQGVPLVSHGDTFSLFMNYDALDRYVAARGGEALYAPHRDTNLIMALHVVGASFATHPHLQLAFQREFQGFNPRDYDDLYSMIDEESSALSPRHVLVMLRLSHWDPDMLEKFRKVLVASAQEIQGWLKEEIVEVLDRVWANHFRIQGRPESVALVIGVILQALDRPVDALTYYQQAEPHDQQRVTTRLRRAMCHVVLNQWDEGLGLVTGILEEQPDHTQARQLQRTLMMELARGSD